MPWVEVPRRYRLPTRGEGRIEVDGRSVRECLEAVEARYPGFRELVLEEQGELRRFVRIFVDGKQLARDALDERLASDGVVAILAGLAGG